MPTLQEAKQVVSRYADAYADYCQKTNVTWEKYELPLWLEYIKWLNLQEPNLLIMDIGTGYGRLIDLLISSGASCDCITAIEPNHYMHKKFTTLHPSIPCVPNHAQKELPKKCYQSQQYDLVVSNLVLNMIDTKSYEKITQAVFGMLEPGGAFAYVVPEPKRKAWQLGIPLNTHENHVVEDQAPWGGIVLYHHRSAEYQIAQLERVGFEVNYTINAKRLMVIADKP